MASNDKKAFTRAKKNFSSSCYLSSSFNRNQKSNHAVKSTKCRKYIEVEKRSQTMVTRSCRKTSINTMDDLNSLLIEDWDHQQLSTTTSPDMNLDFNDFLQDSPSEMLSNIVSKLFARSISNYLVQCRLFSVIHKIPFPEFPSS